MDEDILNNLNNVIKLCKDKFNNNINEDSKVNTDYLIISSVLRALIYCIEENKIDKFNTILEYISKSELQTIKNIRNNII